MSGYDIETLGAERRAAVDALIVENWAGPYVATKGRLHDTRTQPGFVALMDGEVVGYALYTMEGGECELTVLEALVPWRGIGKMLLSHVSLVARVQGCSRLFLITTNDNTPAIRYYQRAQFELVAVHIGGVDRARALKPTIPLIGLDGIEIHHEFEFARVLR